METRANHVLIGLFTLAVAIAAFGFVWWFAGNSAPSRMIYRVAFTGSVSGLTQGSTVTFNGIRVGEVSAIKIDPKQPNRVIATIAVDPTTPMRTDTTAGLEYQGLTGVSSIALSGTASTTAQPLPGNAANPPVIVGQSSGMQDLMAGARHVLEHVDELAINVNKLVTENGPPLSTSVKNIEHFTAALAANSDNVSHFLDATGKAANAITALSHQLQALSVKAQAIIAGVDPDKVRAVVDNTATFTDSLAASGPKVKEFAENAAELTKSLSGEAKQLGGTLNKIDAVVAAVDPKKVGGTVDSINAFAETLRDHRPDIDAIVQNTKDLTARLNDTSKKLGGLIDNANSFLGQGQKSGVFAEVGDAAKSIKTLADHLDQRTKKLSDELSGFSGPGLRSLQAALSSVRAAAQSIEQVARELQRNPQRFLFGGTRVRDYPSGG